jgi:cytochrome c oxidase subunit 1
MFTMFAGFYFWWPKMTGKKLDDRIGKIQFWLMFIGFNMTFLVQHWIGVGGHAPPHRQPPGSARQRHRAE